MHNSWPASISNKPTMLYEKSLRSGQNIDLDGNVVILGDVNPGAEIVASGHILVMGALRGLVHAGAAGEEGATVTALSFAPTQLRIASRITRPPEEDAARIKDGEVIIEKYQAPK